MNNTTWSISTRILVIVSILIATIWLGVIAQPFWESISVAALFAILLNPIVTTLIRRTGWSRHLAATLVFVVIMLIIIAIPAWLGTVIVGQVQDLGSEFNTAWTEIKDWLLQPIQIFDYELEARDYVDNIQTMLSDVLTNLPSGSLNILSDVSENLIWVVTVVVALFYLLREGTKIQPWLVASVPEAYQDEVATLLNKLDNIWSKFLRAQLLIFFVLAVLISIGTLLVVWLFRSGLVKWSPVGFILLILLVITLAQQVDNLWMRPQLMGRTLQLHPGIVFVSLLGALALTGVFGAIVIVPIVATVKVVGEYVYAKLLGLPPWVVAESTDAQLALETEQVEPSVDGDL